MECKWRRSSPPVPSDLPGAGAALPMSCLSLGSAYYLCCRLGELSAWGPCRGVTTPKPPVGNDNGIMGVGSGLGMHRRFGGSA